ncbi:MAG: hypothetical protein Q4D51_11225 [Eubacteriales bacterium]|nr:hypothetical protein [Eubacteriales bacterium]
MFEVLGRKLLGEKGRNAVRNVFVAFVVYMGLSNLEYQVNVSLQVLLFTNLFFSGTIILQVLSSQDNARYLKGFFSMPFDEKKFFIGYAEVIGAYTLFTKTALVLALIFAFGKVTALQTMILMVHFVYVCFAAMIVFAFLKDRIYISALILSLSIVACFVLPEHGFLIVVYGIACGVMAFVLSKLDPYRFMVKESHLKKAKKVANASKFMVTKYILRYLLSNKGYVLGGLFMIAFGCFFAKSMEEVGFSNTCGFAMALLAVNTPLAIVVSTNRVLKKKLEMMPDSIKGFFVPYAGFLFGYYMLSYVIFLGVMRILGTELHLSTFVMAIAFALQAAILVATLENRWTIENWKVESDLLHHPRKYIAPAILMVEASLLQFL